MTQEKYTLIQTFRFEAAHKLPHLPETHKCSRLHGHSFQATFLVCNEKDPKLGWVMDYADIREIVNPIIKEHLDHYYLNDVPGLENPTSENIAAWLWQKTVDRLPGLYEITISETCTSACRYSNR